MRLLIFAGAGTSIELGVPGMNGMAREFLKHAEQWKVEPELIDKMMGGVHDVERLIENLDRICDARDPFMFLGGLESSIDGVDTIRSEVEWFVQHVAERILTVSYLTGPLCRIFCRLILEI